MQNRVTPAQHGRAWLDQGDPEARHDVIKAQQGTVGMYKPHTLSMPRLTSSKKGHLKPVMTSSKHSRAPFLCVSSFSPSRNSLVGGMKPELPTTGSRMTPATSSGCSSKSFFTLSRSL